MPRATRGPLQERGLGHAAVPPLGAHDDLGQCAGRRSIVDGGGDEGSSRLLRTWRPLARRPPRVQGQSGGAKQVARFGYRWRDDRRQARVEVHAYAATRADKSSLRRHIEGRPFVRDSAEPGRLESWAPESSPRGRSGPSGKSRSGNSKRGSKGLKYGSTTFTESKWGRKPVAARRKHRRKMTLKKTAERTPLHEEDDESGNVALNDCVETTKTVSTAPCIFRKQGAWRLCE